ncbi:flagellar hook assembly protein FlgD [Marispirochaeta sp.]|uniref:flagellar hook assembly protein FlgD n=1 Tax=Marispirochaeta sp. TaxID=2038653 RepID=UPI0029C9A91F|nr:flagellar hook assembly protein FlgD [Marispirochaeta sp.]
MDISTAMDSADKARTQMQVDLLNKTIDSGRKAKQELDKDDFLKILLTQLTHQDPTEPMKDKEFIAQMAQFSTLEQMTNMASSFTQLSGVMASAKAMNTLGHQVEIIRGDQVIRGTVEAVSGRDFPQVLVNGIYYGVDEIEKVMRQEDMNI